MLTTETMRWVRWFALFGVFAFLVRLDVIKIGFEKLGLLPWSAIGLLFLVIVAPAKNPRRQPDCKSRKAAATPRTRPEVHAPASTGIFRSDGSRHQSWWVCGPARVRGVPRYCSRPGRRSIEPGDVCPFLHDHARAEEADARHDVGHDLYGALRSAMNLERRSPSETKIAAPTATKVFVRSRAVRGRICCSRPMTAPRAYAVAKLTNVLRSAGPLRYRWACTVGSKFSRSWPIFRTRHGTASRRR